MTADAAADDAETTAAETEASEAGDSDATATAGTDHAIDGDAILRLRDLDAGYGDLQILSDVVLDVADGEYVTVVGPNGAGKSTVMKTVFGLTTHMGGTVEFEGEPIHGLAPEQIIREGVGFVPQNDNVFPGLSVRENLEMGAYILDEVPEDQIETIYDRFPILRERSEQKAGTLSGGQRQMVAMGRALMLDPDLLLLDEPSAGLAPDLVSDMFDRIDRINDGGTAVLMVEQNAKEALRRCDRGYVLVNGENRYTDRGDVLLADEGVRQDFLGG
ncbi:ABC transporter ATP-binding protein [Halorubrum ezzemoulense]|jgi:branched-chain amino acid transport system ATP-binding protein|uniref:ABC transporter ATP-binding protein n=1 Tax=Halorubrum ezzemoulense TaxID=337243 RepID=A0ABT4Z0L7_HALEZ|nr:MULTISPECIES: ABC transporter ATP-binding protein [Halorubrum]MDB2223078.1 ABC transporter ATP-binding protein [Halorubrum ezzemoulense]MDB2237956.1 ABC transporter ATP-binding protein [Halorubrum ezzemoulense]MDB2240451.1 ABC transporter ATP-binding protein [Halorubrum ezzemoulense]MDB2243674.1 ABC transporter ATP-binding protein [Halorubrum ezzemoulense]MDB2247425.1 ABC transporter ATP-binding protein [Halorubrum ezzemoulense]